MKLKSYQEKAVKAMQSKAGVILRSPIGSGKTATVLELLAREKPLHVIYISTPEIAYTTLPQEAKKWNCTLPIHTMEPAGEEREKNIRSWRSRGGILLMSFPITHKLPLTEIPQNTWLIVDESTMVKKAGGAWATAVANIAERCVKRVLMTGTLRSNETHHLYQQAAIALGDPREVIEKLGRYTRFLQKYFLVTRKRRGVGGFYEQVRPKPGAEERIMEQIGDLIYVVEPKAEEGEEESYTPPQVLNHVYRITMDERFTRPRLKTVPTVAQLQQLSLGIVYTNGGTDSGEYRVIHDNKISHILKLLQEAQHVIYVYTFIHERDYLMARCKEMGLKVGRSGTRSWQDRWNSKQLNVLFLHPRSAGHGVNLQTGGSIMVFGVPPFDWEAYEQTVGRLARRGQKAPVVDVYEFVTEGSIDEAARGARMRRVKGERAILELWKEGIRGKIK